MLVNDFQAPKIQAVLSRFFHDSNDIAVIVIGVVGGLNIGVQNRIRRQLKAKGPVWGPTGPSLYSQHSKLKTTDIGQPFVACSALQVPIKDSHDHLIEPT